MATKSKVDGPTKDAITRLSSSDFRVVEDAIAFLVVERSKAAVPKLVEILTAPWDTLGFEPKGEEHKLNRLQHELELKRTAMAALPIIGDRGAVAPLIGVCNDSHLAFWAVAALVKFQAADALAVASRLVSHFEAGRIYEALGKMPATPGVMLRLTEVVMTPEHIDQVTAGKAAEALGSIGDFHAVAALVYVVDNHARYHTSVVSEAIKALGKLDYSAEEIEVAANTISEVFRALTGFFSADNPGNRNVYNLLKREAGASIAALNITDTQYAQLEAMLGDALPETRIGATYALASIQRAGSQEMIIGLLESEASEEVRYNAFRALEFYRNRTSIDVLVSYLKSTDEATQRAAYQSLHMMVNNARGAGDRSLILQLQQALGQPKDDTGSYETKHLKSNLRLHAEGALTSITQAEGRMAGPDLAELGASFRRLPPAGRHSQKPAARRLS